MLSYARAAYVYASNSSESEKISEIDSILGEGYDNMNSPDMNKTVYLPELGKGCKSSTLYLGAVPSFRFYLEEGFSKSDFKFTSGTKTLEVKEGSDENGAYLEIVMYAYRMCDDVTYTVTIGDENISVNYNIYSYYSYASEKYSTDTALLNLVKRLVCYSESAKNYKALF